MKHLLVEEAHALLKRGYTPIRIEHGTKAPKYPGWQTMAHTEESIARAFARPSNLGVRCGDLQPDGTRLMAIDIDRDDINIIRCVEHAIGQIVPTKRGRKGVTYFICQTAFKRDPRSASKRDPLFG